LVSRIEAGDEGSKFLRNFGNLLEDYTVLEPRRTQHADSLPENLDLRQFLVKRFWKNILERTWIISVCGM
jgi:hypothetical protein